MIKAAVMWVVLMNGSTTDLVYPVSDVMGYTECEALLTDNRIRAEYVHGQQTIMCVPIRDKSVPRRKEVVE
jgi:ABC-type antimicrobial peptide transport system permease subunit